MKNLLVFFALMVMALPGYAADKAVIGELAPEFSLSDTNGKSHALSDYRGKIVVLEWTNHECPYVKKHYGTGNMQTLQEQATADENVIWLSIVSSAPGRQGYTTASEANAVIEKAGAKATARLLDPTGETGQLYGAKTTPHMYVINAEGTLAYKGAIDDNPTPRPETVKTAKNFIVPALAAVKEGHMPEITQTNPYGCSVKYKLF